MAKYQGRGISLNGRTKLSQDVHSSYTINLQYGRKLQDDSCHVEKPKAANAKLCNGE